MLEFEVLLLKLVSALHASAWRRITHVIPTGYEPGMRFYYAFKRP